MLLTRSVGCASVWWVLAVAVEVPGWVGVAAAAGPPVAPSQVTPLTIQPPNPGGASEIALPEGGGVEVPRGAEGLELTVGRVEVEGGRPGLAGQAEAIGGRFQGRRVSLAAIYGAASELERAYEAAGFPLARVTLPPQRLRDGGMVRLLVTDGFVEEVDVSAVPGRFRDFVRARLAPLIGRRGVTKDEIERAVLLAGDGKGLSLKSAIGAGTQAGGSRLVIEGEASLVSGSVSVDNDLPASLGTWQSSVSLSLNSPFGFGEQAYALFGTALDDQPTIGLRSALTIFGGGGSVPVGVDGATATAEYTQSTTRPHAVAGAPQTLGHFEHATVRFDYPLIRERGQTLTLDATADYISQVNQAPQFGVDLSRDGYATLRTGLTWQRTPLDGGGMVVHSQLSQGVGGRGLADAAMVPLSRSGASPGFTKVNLDAQVSEYRDEVLVLRLFARGQYSFRSPVFVAEQFALDGSDGVSSFPSGTFSVDSGVTLRAELARNFTTASRAGSAVFAPYVFMAIGKGWLYRASPVETASPVAGAFGLGVRLDVQDGLLRGAGIRTEFAKNYSDLPGERAGSRWKLNLVQTF